MKQYGTSIEINNRRTLSVSTVNFGIEICGRNQQKQIITDSFPFFREAITFQNPMHINPKIKAVAAECMLLLGRVIFGTVFLKDAFEHFTPTMIHEAEGKGIFLPYILVPASGIVALLGGLLIIFGFYTKIGAGLIVKVLIPVTVVMHDFWNFSTPHLIEIEFDQFVSNLGLLGAAFILMYFGPGPISLDARLKKRKAKKLAEKEGAIKRKEMHLKIRKLEIGKSST